MANKSDTAIEKKPSTTSIDPSVDPANLQFNVKRSIFEGDSPVDLKNSKVMIDKLKKDLERAKSESGTFYQMNQEIKRLLEKQKSLQEELEYFKNENSMLTSKMDLVLIQLESYEEELKRGREMASEHSVEAPKGDVTLVFTDVQGSTVQWEKTPKAMKEALRVHNDLIRQTFASFGGYEVKTEGDAFMVSFYSTKEAIKCCLMIQEKLLEAKWPEDILKNPDSKVEIGPNDKVLFRGLRVRMGVHTGTPDCEKDPVTGRMDYFGPMVNRSARVQGIAHAGQILVSGDVWDKIKNFLEEIGSPSIRDLGSHKLKGLETDTHILELLPKSLSARTFPPNNPQKAQETEKPGIRDAVNSLQDENAALIQKLESLQNQFTELKQSAGQLTDKVNILKQSGNQDPLVLQTIDEMERVIAEQERLDGKMKELQQIVPNLKKDSRIPEIESALKDALKQVADLQTQLKEKDKQLKRAQEKLQQIQEDQLKSSDEQLKEQQKRVAALEQKVKDEKDKNKSLEEQLKEQQKKCTALEQNLKDRETELLEINQAWQDIKHDFTALKERVRLSEEKKKQKKEKKK